MPRRPLAAALLAIALCAAAADACSFFLYKCAATGDGVVSGRTMDFIPTLDVAWRVEVTPPGRRHAGAPACPDPAACPPPPTWISKFGYAGLTAMNGSILADAMNSEGLSAGYLWLDGSPFKLPYSPDAPGTPMAWLDVVPYLMSHFATVREAVAYVHSDAVQVTTSQPPMPFQRVLRSLGLGEHEVPVHLALHDAAGEAALIEFTSEGTKVYWDAVVVTNDPPYPEHLDWNARWMAEVKRTAGTDEGMDMLPGPMAGYARFPGSFESLARDVRLRMAVDAACREGGPYRQAEWAPRPGGIEPNTAIAMSILRSAEIPWGATGQSIPGTFSAGDSLISFLHEHTTGRYFFRSPGNPRWLAVSLRDADWGAYNGEVRVIELRTDDEAWFGDVTQPAGGEPGAACLHKGESAGATAQA